MLFVSCQKELNSIKEQELLQSLKSKGRQRSKPRRSGVSGGRVGGGAPGMQSKGFNAKSNGQQLPYEEIALRHTASSGPGGFRDGNVLSSANFGKQQKQNTEKYAKGAFSKNNTLFKRTNSAANSGAASGFLSASSSGAIKARQMFPSQKQSQEFKNMAHMGHM